MALSLKETPWCSSSRAIVIDPSGSEDSLKTLRIDMSFCSVLELVPFGMVSSLVSGDKSMLLYHLCIWSRINDIPLLMLSRGASVVLPICVVSDSLSGIIPRSYL